MKKILSFILTCAFALCLFYSPVKNLVYALDAYPTAICMTYYSDIYSRGWAWQTAQTVNESSVLLLKDTGDSLNWDNAQKLIGTNKDFQGYRYHKAQIEGLEPGAKYYYKIGSNNAYSEIASFTVEEENPQDLSFIYVTDSQEVSVEGFQQFNKTLTAASSVLPNSNFIAFGGDLVDNSHADWGSDYSKIKMEEWSYAFDVPKAVLMNTQFMSAPGNHESAGETFIDHSNINYAGSASTGGYYSFDYGNVHFTALNGNAANNESNFKEELEWLKQDLASTTATWKVILIHQGVYSTGDHSNDSDCLYLRSVLPQVMAEYEVDLVMQGHDHVYFRSMPYYYGEGENGKIANREEEYSLIERGEESLNYSLEPDGTYYVTINYAGTKSYPPVEYDTGRIFPAISPVNGKSMSQHVTERMFATVEVEGDELVFKSYISYDNGKNELYDYFAIKKNTYLSASEIIDQLPSAEQITARNAQELYNAKTQVEGLSARALKRLGEERIEKLNGILQTINVNSALAAYSVINEIDALLASESYNAQFWADYASAKNDYYNLTADQMELVVNRDSLLALDQNLIENFAIKEVQSLVNAIESAQNKEQAVMVAKQAYNLLSENAKSKITNTNLLEYQPKENSSGWIVAVVVAVAVIAIGAVAFVIIRRKHEKS